MKHDQPLPAIMMTPEEFDQLPEHLPHWPPSSNLVVGQYFKWNAKRSQGRALSPPHWKLWEVYEREIGTIDLRLREVTVIL